MAVTKFRGLVLRQTPTGETSQQLTVLCKGAGKRYFTARGARQTKSKLLTGTQVFVYGDFAVFEGRGFLSVTQADPVEDFFALRQDMERLACAAYFAELAERSLPEGMEADDQLKLLLMAFTVLAKSDFPLGVATVIYELKFLEQSGFLPDPETLTARFALSPGAEKAVYFVAEHTGAALFSFGLSAETEAELGRMTRILLTDLIPTPLKSRQVLQSLQRAEIP